MDYRASKGSKIVSGLLCALLSGFFQLEAQTVSSTVTITAVVVSPGSGEENGGGSSSGGGGTGGGGGGTTIIQSHESAVFKGLAYPGSIVSLTQNGVIVTEVPASPNGTFEIKVYNLPTGVYTFGVIAEDSNRQKSTIQSYSIYLAENVSTQVAGIFIPPTITTDKLETKRGDPITILGKAPPNAIITINVHSAVEIVKKILSDANGGYVYKLDTSILEIGEHETKSQAITDDDISNYSNTVKFTVGTKNVARTSAVPTSRKCDLNNDNRVNLLDFSIIAYWYKRLGFPPKVDLNGDSRVDLADVSILAYCWTG